MESINYPLHKFKEINFWFYDSMMSIEEFKKLHLEGSKKVTQVIKMLAERLNDGVPTDASVAAILDAIKPLLPTPHKIIFD